MQHGEPCLARGVEALGSDLAEYVGTSLLSIFPIDVEEYRHGRGQTLRPTPDATAIEPLAERQTYRLSPPETNAGDCVETTIVGSNLESFKCIHIEMIVELRRQIGPDPWKGLK